MAAISAALQTRISRQCSIFGAASACSENSTLLQWARTGPPAGGTQRPAVRDFAAVQNLQFPVGPSVMKLPRLFANSSDCCYEEDVEMGINDRILNMILRCLMVLIFVGLALSAQARDIIINSSLGIVNVVDIENCGVPHMRTYASTDVYAKQMASDPRGYVWPYLEAVREYDWFCRRPAYDYVLPIDYYVMGEKIAEFRLKIVQDQPPWIIESVTFLKGVEVPQSNAIDFMSQILSNQLQSQSLDPGLPIAVLEEFANVDDGFIGRADVLELLSYLKYNPETGASDFCKFEISLMEQAAENGNPAAMFKLVECLNEGTSIVAIRDGHPGLAELNENDYNKFRFYLAKAIYSSYLPATLYVSHPIPKFADDVPLDRGTISEILEVVKQFSDNPGMTFTDYVQDSDATRSVTSNAARVALNDWVLSNDCNWLAIIDSASEQGNDWAVVGAILGRTRPTSNGWCMTDNGAASIFVKIGSIDRLNCASAGGEDQCRFVFRQACYATTQFGDIGGRSASDNIFCNPLTMFPSTGFARFTRDEAGKLKVLSFDR